MQTSQRVVFNTVVLYARVVISLLISLISVPIVLKALGVNDYGLFNLVAGVIAMLTFLNTSMNVATQRYLSVAIGSNDKEQLNVIFNAAILLHFIIGLIIVLLFEIVGFFIFDDFLNIDANRITAAKFVYQILVVNTFFTVMSVPYGAVINAKEEMLALSIFHIIKDVLNLLVAIYLICCPFDRLIIYSIGVTVVSIIYILITRLYVKEKHKEFSFHPKTLFKKDVFISMFSFAGWNTFGAIATIGRNQGIAVIFNLFYGTVINAAYGIANQLIGVLSAMTGTFTQSINPQLMQSKGMNNDERLEKISMISSKFSFIMYSFFSVPLIIEMSNILKIWLGTPPEFTLIMSQLVIILSMVQIYSNGLMSAIQATGKIAKYQISMSMLILLNIPLSYFLLKMGCSPYYCIVCFILIEIVCLIVRMLFAQQLARIQFVKFAKCVIAPSLLCVIVSAILPASIHFLLPESFLRIIIVALVYAVIYIITVFLFAINQYERNTLFGLVNRLKNNIRIK